MENLRWILIFAGVAILVLLYFSGRPKRGPGQREVLNKSQNKSASRQRPADTADPLLGDEAVDSQFSGFDEVEPGDFDRPAGSNADPVKSGGLSSISQKIEAFSERLSPKRRARVAASEPVENREEDASDSSGFASKIVTLHVVALDDQLFDGALLLDQFEQHGYHFGEMNIFHSMHHGKRVFSIAKMVEPGYFDIDRIESFETPGVSMILQLPGPVAADVAFEVLVSEAMELAKALGGTVLDADHSSLSKQTIQHMREGIYEYMHRQKYLSSVPS